MRVVVIDLEEAIEEKGRVISTRNRYIKKGRDELVESIAKK